MNSLKKVLDFCIKYIFGFKVKRVLLGVLIGILLFLGYGIWVNNFSAEAIKNNEEMIKLSFELDTTMIGTQIREKYVINCEEKGYVELTKKELEELNVDSKNYEQAGYEMTCDGQLLSHFYLTLKGKNDFKGLSIEKQEI